MTPRMDGRLRACRNFRRDLEKPTSDGKTMTMRFRRYAVTGVQPVRRSARIQSQELHVRRARRALQKMERWELTEEVKAMERNKMIDSPMPFFIGLSDEGFVHRYGMNTAANHFVDILRQSMSLEPYRPTLRQRARRRVEEIRAWLGERIAGKQFSEY